MGIIRHVYMFVLTMALAGVSCGSASVGPAERSKAAPKHPEALVSLSSLPDIAIICRSIGKTRDQLKDILSIAPSSEDSSTITYVSTPSRNGGEAPWSQPPTVSLSLVFEGTVLASVRLTVADECCLKVADLFNVIHCSDLTNAKPVSLMSPTMADMKAMLSLPPWKHIDYFKDGAFVTGGVCLGSTIHTANDSKQVYIQLYLAYKEAPWKITGTRNSPSLMLRYGTWSEHPVRQCLFTAASMMKPMAKNTD